MNFPISYDLIRNPKKFEPSTRSIMPRTGTPLFQRVASKGNTWKMRKWPYLGSWATNKKTKVTFFSSTFKVWESKVSLLFWFVAKEPRYCHCFFFHVFPFDATLWKKVMPAQGLADSLECSNLIFWLLATYLMGKATELIQIQKICFFEHPY